VGLVGIADAEPAEDEARQIDAVSQGVVPAGGGP
jgi:hypothetical protein